MKLSLSDFEIINNMPDRGMIILFGKYSEAFKRDFFDIVKQILESSTKRKYSAPDSATTFNSLTDIYIKWTDSYIAVPNIWISNEIGTFGDQLVKEYTHYIQIKSDSENRAIIYSQTFSI